MRRYIFNKVTILILLTLGFGVAGIQIYRIYQDTQTKLAQSRSLQIEQNKIAVEKIRLIPHLTKKVEIIQNTSQIHDLIYFQDSYFAATSGGLLQLSNDGKVIKHFTVLDGLPESDLTSLAIFEAKLFIGTRTKGLVAYDGENLIGFNFPEREIQAVTNFQNSNGKLLIGTFNGGLLEFNGKDFTELKAENQTIRSITFLKEENASLYVGTFDNGLFILQNGVWKRFSTIDGLPSNRIIGIEKQNENLLVATDFGLSILENEKFRTIKILPMLSSLLKFQDQIYLTKENGEVFTFTNQINDFKKNKDLEKSHLAISNNKLFLLSNHGIYHDFKPFSQTENSSLTDNFVSAISFDQNDNLWAGTFRNGIDIFSESGKKIKHIETDNIKDINSLQLTNNNITAATSKGLWRFEKANFTEKTLAQGAITHFSADAIATSKGLQIGDKFLTNINGLPSSSTYTVLQTGNKIYLGTLGGLAEIKQNKVVKTFTDANSKLTNNWITALCLVNERLFIGTYGGGILKLLPSGELHSFADETGNFVVNPNAIFSDGERLFVGTLVGVKILNLTTNKWSTIKDILPAEAVFAISQIKGNLYFATTNGIAKVNKSYFDEDK